MGIIYRDGHNVAGKRSGSDRRSFADPGYQGPERRITGERRQRAEKRKYTRFLVKNVTFAVIKSGGEEDMGQLLDISRGGLSMRYYIGSKKLKDPHELDIVLADNTFELNDVGCVAVSNFELTDNLKSKYFREGRYGFKFKNLTDYQKSELDYFLITFSAGCA